MGILDDIKGFFSDILDSCIRKQNEFLQTFIKTTTRQNSDDIKSYVRQTLSTNESDIATIRQELYIIKQNQDAIRQDVIMLKHLIEEILKKKEDAPIISPTSHCDEIVKSEHTTLYAGQIDCLNPVGFNISNLKSSIQNDSIFVITMTSSCDGEYEILNNREVIEGVLQVINPIISESSDYQVMTDGVPHDIEVTSKGAVIKDGDILRITKKQKVRIV